MIYVPIQKSLPWFLSALLLMLFFQKLSAQTLTEAQLYQRCYSHLINSPPAVNDARLVKIGQGLLTGEKACFEILDKTAFDQNSGLLKNPDDFESRQLVNNIHSFHHQFFDALDFSLHSNGEQDDISDVTSMALFFTKSLFNEQNSFPLKYILQYPRSLEAKRNFPTLPIVPFDYFLNPQVSHKRINQNNFIYGVNDQIWNPTLIERGTLYGIIDAQQNDLLPATLISDVNQIALVDFDIHANLGGGILGTQELRLLHNGQNRWSKNDGLLKMPRRLTKTIYQSLLCRDLPVVRQNDNTHMVNLSAQAPFKNGATCMSCHGTMEELASVFRSDFVIESAIDEDFNVEASTRHILTLPVTYAEEEMPYEVWKINSADNFFSHRPVKGRFRFRTYDGKLVDFKVHSLEELGILLTEGAPHPAIPDVQLFTDAGPQPENYSAEDLYICAAKRYFYFFTGIDIPLFDTFDLNTPTLGQVDQVYQQQIITWGKQLKADQNLKNLFKNILSSKIYRDRGYKP
jgi:hypothetical protein